MEKLLGTSFSRPSQPCGTTWRRLVRLMLSRLGGRHTGRGGVLLVSSQGFCTGRPASPFVSQTLYPHSDAPFLPKMLMPCAEGKRILSTR
jgi:hypothetical protein